MDEAYTYPTHTHTYIVFHVENSRVKNTVLWVTFNYLTLTVSICPRRSGLIVLQAFHVIVEKVTEGRR